MPPRRQPTRQVQTNKNAPDAEVIAMRAKRHLDELERSNYLEESSGQFEADKDEESVKTTKGRVLISDRRLAMLDGGRRKKSTHDVRSAVLYRKNLATLIDESGIADLPASIPTYLTAVVASPQEPSRVLCSVCGYWGSYKCMKCAMAYCDINCRSVHDETRCERRI
ncbi:hypothetical protein K488DRAFT_40881 [Vararia minispora EC-137]|uniref:Uncharacterized protein n=1 Tax=Vararia minispora EC-137 TaxID=1314806 RepID=A0ACB8QXK0_9AGAM|nr:hypothetical protein K488DRAFT_40881 [Vararia minispora EC-137]